MSTVTDTDTPAIVFSDADSDVPPVTDAPTERTCAFAGCENPIVKTGPGRPPKFCPEHTGAKKTSSGRPSVSTSTKSSPWPQAATVEKALSSYLEGIAWGVGFLNPIDAQILVTNGPAVVHELVELGRTDRTTRKYLMYLATPGKYGPLTLAVFGLVFPIAVNHGLISRGLFGAALPDSTANGGE